MDTYTPANWSKFCIYELSCFGDTSDGRELYPRIRLTIHSSKLYQFILRVIQNPAAFLPEEVNYFKKLYALSRLFWPMQWFYYSWIGQLMRKLVNLQTSEDVK